MTSSEINAHVVSMFEVFHCLPAASVTMGGAIGNLTASKNPNCIVGKETAMKSKRVLGEKRAIVLAKLSRAKGRSCALYWTVLLLINTEPRRRG